MLIRLEVIIAHGELIGMLAKPFTPDCNGSISGLGEIGKEKEDTHQDLLTGRTKDKMEKKRQKKERLPTKEQLELSRLFLELALNESILKQVNSQLRQNRFEKRYFNEAWKLEKVRCKTEPRSYIC